MVIIKKNILEKIDEKILLIAIIGNLEAVRNNVITIDEAEKFLFSPYMVEELRVKMCNKKIIELIMKGCELEDIASLIPEKFNEVIEEMKAEALMLIRDYEEFNEEFWIED